MKVKKLRIIEFSDVHVGSRNTPTTHILNNLNNSFKDHPSLNDVDIIFIAGDFFDGLMSLPDPNSFEIRLWINCFLRICKKRDIVLRVLEGTPSHDWKQSRLFTHINDVARIEADVKYIETLSIEYIERFGINVLYVPDEWNPECDDTWVEVQQLMAKENLTQVDFSVMHGAFDYQLPHHVKVPTHVPERYLEITKYLIYIGHIHRHSVYERIVSAGSFDRLTHGEEEPKGYIDSTIYSDGRYEVTFVENEAAMIYKTIKVTGLSVEKAIRKIESVVKNLPQHCFVRIKAAREDSILVSMEILKVKFPQIRFTTKIDEDKEPVKQTVIDIKASYQPIPITRVNIEKMLLERLENRSLPGDKIMKARELLKQYV